MFHLHEEVKGKFELSAETLNATTTKLGFFTDDPDVIFEKAVTAGAKPLSHMQDYDYGYRQGSIVDPFNHHWTFQKNI